MKAEEILSNWVAEHEEENLNYSEFEYSEKEVLSIIRENKRQLETEIFNYIQIRASGVNQAKGYELKDFFNDMVELYRSKKY